MADKETTVLSTELIYSGRILNLRVDTISLSGGRTASREVVEHVGAVAVVPVNNKGEVILVRQQRHATGQTLLEIPAGKLEHGESAIACARRELQEETGFVANNLEKMFSCFSTPGFSNELLHVFLATDLTFRKQMPDFDEDIEIVIMPLANAVQLIWTGDICDAKSIAGLFAALQKLKIVE